MGAATTGYALLLALATVVCAALAAYAWRHQHARGALAFAVQMAALAGWTLAHMLVLLASDLATKLLFAGLRYVGAGIALVAYFAVVLEFTGSGHRVTRRNLALLALVPLATVLLVFTNEAHGLIWRQARLDPNGPGLQTVHGPFFWVQTAWGYSVVLACVVLLLRELLRAPQRRRQVLPMLVSSLIPWAANVVFLLGPFAHLPDFTPFAFTLSGLAVAWAVSEGFLELVPLGRAAVLEGMPDGVVVLDGAGRVLDMNPAAREALGTGAERALGRRVSDALPFLDGVQPAADGESEFTLGDDKARRDYALRVVALRAGDGSMAGRVLVWRDVTARKRLEEERARVECLREDLTHALVHDLRNPLTSIGGILELVDTTAELQPERRRLVGIARGGVRQMRALVDAILDVSRLEAGRMPLRLEQLALPPLVAEALELQAALAQEKRLSLESHLPGTLPEVRADRELLGRVLQNLLANAIKFTPEGGRVRVSALAEGGSLLRVSVSDSGAGLPPEVAGRLFQKFVTGRQKGRGSGLGLAFCRLAVEAQGGTIRAENAPEAGAVVSFTLPARGSSGVLACSPIE